MNPAPRLTQLNDAVLEFETLLEVDVDDGDRDALRKWAKRIRIAFDDLQEIIDAQRHQIHKKLYRKIEDADPSQAEAIDELERADREIEDLLEVVRSHIVVLQIEADEEEAARLENQTEDDEQRIEMTSRGAELVCWIRHQEETVTAWFAEAFVET